MSSATLFESIFDGGIRSVHFFNGRLLSGEDLTQEQKANREARARLAGVVGDGVAYGLDVSTAIKGGAGVIPKITITPGLGLNRAGQPLLVSEPASIELSLPQTAPLGSGSGSAAFHACMPPSAGVYVPGACVYVLTIAPASGTQGKVPVSGLGYGDAPCNARYRLDGVTFKLHQLDVAAEDLLPSARPKLRSKLASRCFRSDVARAFASDPFGAPAAPSGGLAGMRPSPALTDDDVPLALILLTTEEGVVFIDAWSVRRRLSGPRAEGNASDQRWSALLGERRRAESEAMILQFQAQIDELWKAAPESIVATSVFDHLPPVGVLPLTSARSSGFRPTTFFSGLTAHKQSDTEPLYLEAARLESLVRLGSQHTPIELVDGEMLWLYRVRENAEAALATTVPAVQPYLVFATGHMPYMGHAKHDVARFDYSNYF